MNKNELILEIIKLCLEKSKRNKNTIFFEYYGHCNLFRIEIDKEGWCENIDPDYREEVFMDLKNDKQILRKLNEILEYLKNLED